MTDEEQPFQTPTIERVTCIRCERDQPSHSVYRGVCWSCMTQLERAIAVHAVKARQYDMEQKALIQGEKHKDQEPWADVMRRCGRL
jgi:hypothetical protein